MQTVKLNLIPGSVMPVVNVSQYDAHRQFALQVYEGAAAYSLTGKTVEIRGTKPDGNGFSYDAQDGVVSVSGNTVTISTTQQMTAVGGQTMAELRIKSGTTILGTINFILDVEHSALSDDTPISETEIPVIERDFAAALEEAQEAAETATTKAGEASTSATSAAGSATSAAADALKAEGYAVGKQNGSPVESESPYYLNNAEYYARHAGEQAYNASQSATAAGNSATAAAGDSLEAEGFAVGEQNGTPVGPDSPYYHNNAAYYAQEAGQHASGGIIFKGSLAFADLPTVGMASGDEYNITDDFTTDSRFIEGAGHSVKAGTNIAWVAGNVNKWDILATGGGAEALSDMTDVTITSAADGDLLQYNGTSGEWENSDEIPQELAAMQEAGAVNLFHCTAVSNVNAGITWTIDDDSVITANGTATANSALNTTSAGDEFSFPFDVIVSGLPMDDPGSTKYFWSIGGTWYYTDKVKIPANTSFRIVLWVMNGYTANNLKFKIMIYDARLVNPPYQPFTMTNRELTDGKISGRGAIRIFTMTGTTPSALNTVVSTTIPGSDINKYKYACLALNYQHGPGNAQYQFPNPWVDGIAFCSSSDFRIKITSDDGSGLGKAFEATILELPK